MVRFPTFELRVLDPRAIYKPGPKVLREPKATFEPRVLEPRATFEHGPKGLRELKATFEPRVLEPRATYEPGPKALGSRRPHSNRVFSNRVRQLSKVYV